MISQKLVKFPSKIRNQERKNGDIENNDNDDEQNSEKNYADGFKKENKIGQIYREYQTHGEESVEI